MAKRTKTVEVQKFGGVDDLGVVQAPSAVDLIEKNYNHDVKSLEVKSSTHLEDDQGGGGAAIVRCFEFGINPQAFKEYSPTRQELFNAHYKGIEMALWKDGMKVIPEVNPRIVIDQENGKYQIFVGAQPMRGHILTEKPKTLSEQIHGR
jgi:hypothetical protein